VLENSKDEVVNIINEDNVRFESLDPNTIVLNDGWNNLERIADFEAAEAAIAAAASDNTKPADTNIKIEVDGGESGSDNKSPSEASDHEGSPELDLSNKELLVVDLSNEGSDEETSDEELSGEITVDEVLSGEDTVD